MLDIFTAVTMLSTQSWSNQIFNQCQEIDGCIPIPFETGKWLFVGCIIFGFLLVRPGLFISILYLSYQFRSLHTKLGKQRKSLPVVTFPMLSLTSWQITTTLSVRLFFYFRLLADKIRRQGSYDHFCFFDHISNSTKTSDDFAFFVFFAFKSA
jgi:hypothetical protein